MSFSDAISLFFVFTWVGFFMRYGAWVFDSLLEILGDLGKWLLSHFRKEP